MIFGLRYVEPFALDLEAARLSNNAELHPVPGVEWSWNGMENETAVQHSCFLLDRLLVAFVFLWIPGSITCISTATRKPPDIPSHVSSSCFLPIPVLHTCVYKSFQRSLHK